MYKTNKQFLSRAVGTLAGLVLVSQASAGLTPDIYVNSISMPADLTAPIGFSGKAEKMTLSSGDEYRILTASSRTPGSTRGSAEATVTSLNLAAGTISGSFSITGNLYDFRTGTTAFNVGSPSPLVLLTGTTTRFELNGTEGAIVYFTTTGGEYASAYGLQGKIQYHFNLDMPGKGYADITPVPEASTCLAGLAAGMMLAVNMCRSKKS